MKGAHWIDTGQWPAACVIIADKRAYGNFMRQKCGKHEFRPFPPSHAGSCTQLDGANDAIMVIALGPDMDEIERAATLAHEATHAMRWILDHAEEKSPGTETEAYLVEHIVRQGLKALQ